MVERGKSHYGAHGRPSLEAVLQTREPGHYVCRDCRQSFPKRQLVGGSKRLRCPACGGLMDRVRDARESREPGGD